MKHIYRTQGTCATQISFDMEDGVVRNVAFTGGCNGNLKAVSTLVDGMTPEQIAEKCKGIKCGFKQTSCADQLANAVLKAYNEEK